MSALFYQPFSLPKETKAAVEQSNEIKLTNHFISEQLSDECWLLSNGCSANRSFSCLIEPQVGDQIIAASSVNDIYIIAIIARAEADLVNTLSLPQQQSCQWQAEQLTLVGREKISILSAKEIVINVSLGQLVMSAQDILQTVQNNFVLWCKQFFQKADQVDIQTSQLTKSHSHNQIITADNDIRIDAERINLG